MNISLDANCFIDAFNPHSQAHVCMKRIFAHRASCKVKIFVSMHTIHELERKPDAALDLAKIYPKLPYWPIGTINEILGTIAQLTGTFDDARRNHEIEQELAILAKSGNDIRDRGALIDALHAAMDYFVTSDTQLVGSGPAGRIQTRFGLGIIRPAEAVMLMEQQPD